MKTPYWDDGAGGDLREYPLGDIIDDYTSMLEAFGPDDSDVQSFKHVLNERGWSGLK